MNVTVLSSEACTDCRVLKRMLDKYGVVFSVVDASELGFDGKLPVMLIDDKNRDIFVGISNCAHFLRWNHEVLMF